MRRGAARARASVPDGRLTSGITSSVGPRDSRSLCNPLPQAEPIALIKVRATELDVGAGDILARLQIGKVQARPSSGHSGARPQAESPESITTGRRAWIPGSPALRYGA